MTYYEIRFAWNAQADDGNRWHSLSVPEKIEWAAIHAAAKERTARQAAQAEVVALKERIARAGVEQRRAVREAVLQEREACAKACEGLEANRDWVPGSLWGNIRIEMAAAIRARGEPEQPTLPYHPAMMNEIINMADEIAICFSADSKEFDHDGLLRFAAMVQANEREACAQVCESQAGPRSWLRAKYGVLGESWRDDLRQGFAECFRVLSSNGTLIFKWAEDQVKVREVLELAPHPPLFGHPTGRKGLTHWMVFMKPLEKSQ